MMIQVITITSPTTAHGLCEQFAKVVYDGENVCHYVSVAHGIIDLLKNSVGAGLLFLLDMIQIIGNGLKKCSSDEFVSHIKTIIF